MAAGTPYHHALVVGDSSQFAAALEVLGFERIPEDEETREMARLLVVDGGPQAIVALRHAVSGQRIDLLEVPGTEARDAIEDGDITIGVPVQGDPAELYRGMQAAAPGLRYSDAEDAGREKGIRVAVDGQQFVLTQKKEPFTAVHYNLERWPQAERFYEDMLGFCYFALPNRGDTVRTRLENAPMRVDLEASPSTLPAGEGEPRRAAYRIVNDKFGQAAKKLAERGVRWVREPGDGRAELIGPLGERIEMVDGKEIRK